jgi:hypothetical protein
MLIIQAQILLSKTDLVEVGWREDKMAPQKYLQNQPEEKSQT